MKRIIITERQYKRLVNLPLNEQNVGGGEIKFSEGYSENDIKGNRVWKFLNVLREKLWEKYNKNLFIIEVGDTLDFNLRYDYLIVDLDLDKYTKKENRYIKKLTKEETGSPGSIFYNIKYGYIYFPLTDSEFENDQTGDYEEPKYSISIEPLVRYPGEIEGITIDDIEDLEKVNDTEEDVGRCESGNCIDGDGVFKFENGDVYTGTFSNGNLVEGTFVYANGDKYVGLFLNGEFNEEGTFIDIETKVEYYGIWEDGELTGTVTIQYDNGDEYTGEFKNDEKNGEGVYKFENGDDYVGNFIDNKFSGEGSYYMSDKTLTGIFENDKFISGVIIYSNGTEDTVKDGVIVKDEELSDITIDNLPDDTNDEELSDITIDNLPDDTNDNDIVGECYTKDEVKLYQNNIKDLKETNDFRYWVSQDKDRLKKVNDKLKKCDMPDGLDMSGSYDDESPYMIVAFSEIGQEWVDDKKPIKVVPPLSTNYDDPAMGLPTGEVGSGLAMTGGTDGNWNGSMPRLLAIAKMAKDYFDVNVTSQKREEMYTANGSTSAHYYKNFGKYAIDLRVPTVKNNTPKNTKGDDLFNKIVELLGKPNLESGKWRPIKYKGYRYNVGWRADGDHMNHIHIGVNKL